MATKKLTKSATKSQVPIGFWVIMGAAVGLALGAAFDSLVVWLILGVAAGTVSELTARKR